MFYKHNNIFNKRKRGRKIDSYVDIFQGSVIGRICTIYPSNTECFYLHLLLHKIKAPTQFEALKAINNTIHPTYQSGCKSIKCY